MACSPRPVFDTTDPVLATAAWSRLSEPTDKAAAALVSALGAVGALRWLLEQALDPSGELRDAPEPPLPGQDGASTRAAWAQAASRWQPRLADLGPRRDLERLEQIGGSLIVPGDPWWPTCLEDLDSPPLCLWVRGDPALLVSREEAPSTYAGPGQEVDQEAAPRCREDLMPAGPGQGRAIAVVGARAASAYGQQVATEIAASLTGRGCLVVSGGAFGVDVAAHRGALSAGPTVSVSAGGVDRLYPAGNTRVLERVVDVGLLVSEVPPGCAPARHRFLTRNRIIAALCGACLVVEAAWRSGALSTAHHALELGRPLGAVPGPVTSMGSVGCHRLLRSGAVCVTDAEEALELLLPLGAVGPDGGKAQAASAGQGGLLDGLDPVCAAVLDALPARASAQVERVAQVAGVGLDQARSALGLLEIGGRVEREGSRWRRSPQPTKP